MQRDTLSVMEVNLLWCLIVTARVRNATINLNLCIKFFEIVDYTLDLDIHAWVYVNYWTQLYNSPATLSFRKHFNLHKIYNFNTFY